MTTDTQDFSHLRALAAKAAERHTGIWSDYVQMMEAYHHALNPGMVIALLVTLEALQAEIEIQTKAADYWMSEDNKSHNLSVKQGAEIEALQAEVARVRAKWQEDYQLLDEVCRKASEQEKRLAELEKQEPIGCGYVVKWASGDTPSTYRTGYAQVHGVDVYAVAGASPDQSALQAENAKLITALAACRDAFPVPKPDTTLDGYYTSAMADPLEVPEYVKACLGASPVDPDDSDINQVHDGSAQPSRANSNDIKYTVALQRSIEIHCDGKTIPESLSVLCPHHAKMLNDKLVQPSQAGELSDADISKLAAPYGSSSIQGFDHIKAYTRATIAALNAKESK